jgi:hypothetical protein
MAAMSSSKTRLNQAHTRLLEAADDQVPVKIQRLIGGCDTVVGFVIGVGAEWVLLANFDQNWFAFDGFVAVRVADIEQVKRLGEPDSVEVTALKLHGLWPAPELAGINLDDTAELLRTAGDQFDMLTIHPERIDTEICYLGRVASFGNKQVTLQTIDPKAVWDDQPDVFRLRDVTRLQLGDRYATTLLEIGGPAPRWG